MEANYHVRYTTSTKDMRSCDTERPRNEFLARNLMESNKINLVYSYFEASTPKIKIKFYGCLMKGIRSIRITIQKLR